MDTQAEGAMVAADDAPPAGTVRRDLDVRPIIASGQPPFDAIMEEVDTMGEEEALVLRSPFDPKALHTVLGRRGYVHVVRELGPADVETTYWRPRPDGSSVLADPPDPPQVTPPVPGRLLDVRGLEPPEPMERTLQALDVLPLGEALVQLNERVPIFLLPELTERGFLYRIEQDERGVLVTIWKAQGE